jgi:chromosomal replication initiation ATPase DnaA
MSKNNSTLLIEILLKTIDKMGIKKTIQVLEIGTRQNSEENILVEAIIANTTKEFNITEDILINGRQNFRRVDAVGICAVLLQRMTNLNQRMIANRLHKDYTLLNKYIHKYENLDPNIKTEAELIEKMDAIRETTMKQFEIK